ncbi:MAG: DMT family transporter [Vicinamibacterales bacterium]
MPPACRSGSSWRRSARPGRRRASGRSASRLLSTIVFTSVALATGRPAGVPRAALAPALVCGVLDMAANALYLIAVRQGSLGVVATLVSLYPASTVLLARLALHERLGPWQQVGVAGAVVAIILIVSG